MRTRPLLTAAALLATAFVTVATSQATNWDSSSATADPVNLVLTAPGEGLHFEAELRVTGEGASYWEDYTLSLPIDTLEHQLAVDAPEAEPLTLTLTLDEQGEETEPQTFDYVLVHYAEPDTAEQAQEPGLPRLSLLADCDPREDCQTAVLLTLQFDR